MRLNVVLLLSICLFVVQHEACGQSGHPQPSIGDASALRVQTISVRRGPLFHSSQTTSDSDSSAPGSSGTLSSAIDRQDPIVKPRPFNRPGTQVLLNAPPTSTMIEHVIVAPAQTQPSAYRKYRSPMVMHRANNAITNDYLASQTYDDGWNAWQTCCDDPWSNMCPCCDDRWDCDCCSTSPIAWLNGERLRHGVTGAGACTCRHCQRRAVSNARPCGPETGASGECTGREACDAAPSASDQPPRP